MEPATNDLVEILLPVVAVLGFSAVFGIIIFASVRRSRRSRENLGRLGAAMGLNFQEPEGRSIFKSRNVAVAGQLRGRPIRIHSFTRGSGKNTTHWCAARVVAENSRSFELAIASESVFTRIGERLGFSQALVGDEAFDRRFYIKCSDEAFLRAALIPEIRARFIDAWARGAGGKVTVDGDDVSYVEQGAFADDALCARIPVVSDLLCDVAEVVETHSRMA